MTPTTYRITFENLGSLNVRVCSLRRKFVSLTGVVVVLSFYRSIARKTHVRTRQLLAVAVCSAVHKAGCPWDECTAVLARALHACDMLAHGFFRRKSIELRYYYYYNVKIESRKCSTGLRNDYLYCCIIARNSCCFRSRV